VECFGEQSRIAQIGRERFRAFPHKSPFPEVGILTTMGVYEERDRPRERGVGIYTA
jgi:hypothetical protein